MSSLDRVNRWMYRGGKPNALARGLNRMWGKVFATGRGPDQVATLEVVGRKSGKPVTLPVVIADWAGERYLVSMLGDDVNWVRNVRAAGGNAHLLQGARTPIRLEQIPPSERAPIIKRYAELAPGGRSHIPVDHRAPAAEFEPIAARYPVFRIDPR